MNSLLLYTCLLMCQTQPEAKESAPPQLTPEILKKYSPDLTSEEVRHLLEIDKRARLRAAQPKPKLTPETLKKYAPDITPEEIRLLLEIVRKTKLGSVQHDPFTPGEVRLLLKIVRRTELKPTPTKPDPFVPRLTPEQIRQLHSEPILLGKGPAYCVKINQHSVTFYYDHGRTQQTSTWPPGTKLLDKGTLIIIKDGRIFLFGRPEAQQKQAETPQPKKR